MNSFASGGSWIKNLLSPHTRRLFFCLAVLFSSGVLGSELIFLSGAEAEAGETLRVLIVKDVSRAKFSGEGLNFYDLKSGRFLWKTRKYSSFLVERDRGPYLRVRGRSLSSQGFTLYAAAGPLAVNGRLYGDKLKILPGPNGDIWVINTLPLERYLAGLVNSEVSSQWTLEALKAQVVAARTYAFYQRSHRRGELYDVDSGVNDQVYGGVGREDARSRRAVQETSGELLLYGGNPIFAVYSSCCGGKTEPGDNMWEGYFPYLRSVECNYCLDSPHFLWNHSLDGQTMGKALNGGRSAVPVLGLEIGERSVSRRVLKLILETESNRREVSGKDFRRLLGYDQLRSTNFILTEKDGIFQFSGLGWGHGVGLCQWGAKGMAEAGMGYRTILKHYYRDVEIGRISH